MEIANGSWSSHEVTVTEERWLTAREAAVMPLRHPTISTPHGQGSNGTGEGIPGDAVTMCPLVCHLPCLPAGWKNPPPGKNNAGFQEQCV